MVFQVSPSVIAASQPMTKQPRCQILERTQYRSCHIQVPEDSQRLAAICVDGQYYSFFRLVKDRQKTLQISDRLAYHGNGVIITQTVKGDALWLYEPNAQTKPLRPTPSDNQRICENSLWRILESLQGYQVCQVRVAGVTKPLEAIVVDHKYYGFMRRVRSEAEAIELADRLAKKGNASIITKSDRTYTIWVLEPDATIDKRSAENQP
jgi:hypothetical protein